MGHDPGGDLADRRGLGADGGCVAAPVPVAVEVTLDGQLTSWVTEFFDLTVELGGVSDALVPAPMQVAGVRIDNVRALESLGDDVVDGAGVDELADGGLMEPDFPADGRFRHALCPQLVDGGMLIAQPGDNLQLGKRLQWLRLRVRRDRRAGAGQRLGQPGAMDVYRLLHGLAEVLPQVEPVGDLLGLRCPKPCALAVSTGTVPTDDLDLGVTTQPRGQVLAVAAVEHIERTMGVHVDQHGAVVTAFAEGEVIHPEHLHRTGLRIGQCSDQPQQRVPPHRDADRGRHPHSRPPGQGEPNLRQHPAQQRSVAAVRSGQARDLLSEGHCGTGRVLAAETAYAQLDHDTQTTNSDITQPPHVTAVHPPRALTAPASRGRRPHPRPQHDPARSSFDLLDQQRRQVRKQLQEHITRARDS